MKTFVVDELFLHIFVNFLCFWTIRETALAADLITAAQAAGWMTASKIGNGVTDGFHLLELQAPGELPMTFVATAIARPRSVS